MTKRSGCLAILLALLLQGACVSTSPAPPPERRDPSTGEPALEGSRYETMRVLARRLAELSETVRQDALAEGRSRAGEDGLSRLSELAERARQFHGALENYTDPPRYIRASVRELEALVRDTDDRFRSARLSERTQRSWREALDVMDRMSRVASGETVDLPPAYPDSREGPVFPSGPTSPSDDTWRSDSGLSQRELEDLHRMARELAVRATLAREGAERAGSASSEAERRLLRDLEDFRVRARELERRTDSGSGSLDRRDLRATVDRLNEDARRIDRELRDGGYFTGVWSDWTEVLLLVRRLADLVRR